MRFAHLCPEAARTSWFIRVLRVGGPIYPRTRATNELIKKRKLGLMLMQLDGTSEGQLELALETAKTAAYKAGKWLKEKRGHAEVISKKARRDGLLDADLAAEQMIIDLLHAEFPTYGILSEETQQEWEYSPYKWVIDPLDGSANFQHGSPIFAIAISLLVEWEILPKMAIGPRTPNGLPRSRNLRTRLNECA